MGVSCSVSKEYTLDDINSSPPLFKIAVIGDKYVGKTAILKRYAKNTFSESYLPTKYVDIINVTKKVNIPDDMIISLSLWDAPGQDDVDLSETYYKNVDAIIVVVDLTNENSMEMAGFWRQQFINTITKFKHRLTSSAYEIPALLLGNKYDLVEGRAPNADYTSNSIDSSSFKGGDDEQPECVLKLSNLAKQHRFISGVLVSAKHSDGSIHLAMQTLLRHLINKHFEKSTSQNHVKEKPDRKTIPREVEETILTLTGHEQVDALIRESEGLVCRVAELKTSYYKTLDVFKLACVDAEVIPGENYSKTTLEQCITALKSRIGQDKLIADNCGEGVIQMRIKEDIDIMREFTRALRLFNESLTVYNQFAVICSVILAENEDLRSSIKAYDDKILQMAKEIMERQNSEPDKDPNNLSNSTFSYEEMSAVIEANRVGLSESLVQIEQLYNNATRVKEKVMATLMW